MPLSTDERMLTLSRVVIEAFDKANGGVHAGFRPARMRRASSSPERSSRRRAPRR